ncbi:hypothetical protein DRE_01028 [Drechslerella stenobrocha 248]|uniref:RING-type domain-containing protein n=1 Tax=Drechslerella stenobrocha 248 TaxID=1043628 RepID=W7HPA4_9PEZI|nr:hypothetical protein DRE_01028 [Drechslerella stenobrocha 248]
MTSPGNIPLGSKAQQISQASQNIQSAQSGGDQQLSSHQRSSNGGNNGGASASNRNQATPRNGQSSKARHKNHRRPSVQKDDAIAEAIAMTSSTISRKGRTSITHLMDWSLPPPRNQHTHHHHSRGLHGNRRHSHWGGYHSVDKARYVNANYRFIVDPSGDYKSQSLDPDSPLPWGSVLRILASSITQASSCPICLCDPVAPRMARCGHIFCLPCLIRYMASEDDSLKPGQQGYYHPTANQNKEKWKKCPICHDSVYMKEVRPVKFYQGQETPPPQEGSDITLRLMMRQPGSTLALPKDVASVSLMASGKNDRARISDEGVAGIPWNYEAEVTDYARIMRGTRGYLQGEYEREIAELEEQERVDELMFGDETDWVKKAIAKVRSAIEGVKDLPDKEEQAPERLLGRELYELHLLEEARVRAEQMQQREPIVQQTEHEVPEMYLVTSSSALNGIAHDRGHGGTGTETSPPESTAPPLQGSAAPPKSPTSRRAHPTPKPMDTHDPTQPYFFYQALPHSYLSPLDIRILKVAFGSFSSFPSTVLPRVENFSMGHVVDDEVRKRARYLSHLPSGCEVAFLECDWTDIVPVDVLARFEPDLERRRRKKREKETREERERVLAEREEDEKRWSAARRSRGGGGVDVEDELGMAMKISQREFDAANLNNGTLFETPGEEEEAGLVPNGPKFGFGSLPQSSPPSSRTVWGTPMIAGGSRTAGQQQHTEPEQKNASSEWMEGWQNDVVAIERSTATGERGGGGGKGKKKFKKVTLMTNTGQRGA